MPTTRRAFPRPHLARLTAAVAMIACMAGLAGCGSTIASLPYVGEPPEAQASRPAATTDYPDPFTKPAAEAKPLTAAERQKFEAELTAARDRSAAQRREEINQPGPR